MLQKDESTNIQSSQEKSNYTYNVEPSRVALCPTQSKPERDNLTPEPTSKETIRRTPSQTVDEMNASQAGIQ